MYLVDVERSNVGACGVAAVSAGAKAVPVHRAPPVVATTTQHPALYMCVNE